MVGEGSGAQKIGRVKSKTQPQRVNGNHKSKGGLDNYKFRFKGVRQRSSGKWVAEIKEPKEPGKGKRKRKWLGTFTTAQEASRAYDREAFALYGSQAQFNLQPSSSRPPVFSHPTTLRPLLPRPKPLYPRPYPEPRLQHHFLLSGSPPSTALQFSDVTGSAMLIPATSMPHPQHHFLLSGSPPSAALQFNDVPVHAMLMPTTSMPDPQDHFLLSGSPPSAALQFSEVPGHTMLMPATSMPHPQHHFLLSGSPTSAAHQFSDVVGRAMQKYSFFNPQTSDENLHPTPPQSALNIEKAFHDAATVCI